MNASRILLALALCLPAMAHETGGAHRIDYAKARETAYGKPFDPAKAARTIEVEMSDTMRFSPARIEVKRGDSVRFVATNSGKLPHEMVLGTLAELREHAEHMRHHPGMEHDAPNMLHVAPGAKGEMGWRFTRAGQFFFGCLEPGHFEAGMVGQVVVGEP
jgi:uncharacterized cupredoxin-like copper-binding protein